MTTIKTTDTKILVKPMFYNSKFNRKAKTLGGDWEPPYWAFDIRDERIVRETSMKYLGSDGFTTDLVDVRVSIPDGGGEVGGYRSAIELFGRTIARAFNRDSGAKQGEGIVLEKGGFDSGGSARNWRTKVKDNTVFIMRDVARRQVERHNKTAFIIEILDTQKPTSKNEDDLIEEREKLLARLAEINSILGT